MGHTYLPVFTPEDRKVFSDQVHSLHCAHRQFIRPHHFVPAVGVEGREVTQLSPPANHVSDLLLGPSWGRAVDMHSQTLSLQTGRVGPHPCRYKGHGNSQANSVKHELAWERGYTTSPSTSFSGDYTFMPLYRLQACILLDYTPYRKQFKEAETIVLKCKA